MMNEEWKVLTAYPKEGFLIEITNDDSKVKAIANHLAPEKVYVSSYPTKESAMEFIRGLEGYEPGWENGNVSYE
tara:strand:+ start:928 stop:1149 length:222 start_codon:yes stop_codon:yes gene_type:complete